jgi:glutamate/tyrosine decarboxylase-like PLP-dependent enzyme
MPDGPPTGPDISCGGLFPDPASRVFFDDWLTTALADASAQVREGPVGTATTVQECLADLQAFTFDEPQALDRTLSWIIGRMAGGVVHVNHPRYFGLFNPAPSFPAQCAERIGACFNAQLATATTSPFPVALEAFLIQKLASRLGMPAASSGHFTTGGSEANATALLCALTAREPRFAHDGARAFTGPPTLYISRDAHLAWLKIAHQAGIGRSAIRLVATDGNGRMDSRDVRAQLARDADAGCVPVMIVSTAGTTGAGMIDPLVECGDIAREFGIWHHVDAAWGGALAMSDRLLPLLRGIESADSVTIDAHKWLATTMGCGMFMTSRPSALGQAFHATMDCMPSNDAVWDPYVTTMQWSRRFLGLRLFAAIATVGWQGYAAHVEKAIGLSEILSQRLVAQGWTKVNNSALAVVCMRPPAGSADPRDIAHAVVSSGIAWISTVAFEKETVLRFCITSGETTENDLDRLLCCLSANVTA